MPRKPIDYSKSVIYRIVCRDLEIKDIYVGSTTNLRERRTGHKSSCNNPNDKQYASKVHTFIREHGGWDNWEVVWIEDFPCDNSNQLCARERYYMEKLGSTLNSGNPSVYTIDDDGTRAPVGGPLNLVYCKLPGKQIGFWKPIDQETLPVVKEAVMSYEYWRPPGRERGFWVPKAPPFE